MRLTGRGRRPVYPHRRYSVRQVVLVTVEVDAPSAGAARERLHGELASRLGDVQLIASEAMELLVPADD